MPPKSYEHFAHPLGWLELFNPEPSYPEQILNYTAIYHPYKFTIPGLSKLLMYGNFLKARSSAESKTIADLVNEELSLYNYTRKPEFHEPYFTPVDLGNEHSPDFKTAITDVGLCQVLNGDSLYSTFKESPRTKQLQHSFDPSKSDFEPKLINGTGKLFETTMWLNAANKFTANVNSFDKQEGKLILAVNHWLTYYSVRVNQLELRPGTEVIIKVKPVKHSTSTQFKALSKNDRNCSFKEELEVL